MADPIAHALADRARELLPWIVERRRHLHRHPELSFEEQNTATFVESELRALGIERIRTRLNGNHGLCAEIPGRDEGSIVALRADMDALPIQEETDVPFRSSVPGVGHLCGHDAHTAMLLGVARLLVQSPEPPPSTVRLFFQGSEEKLPGGAPDFIKEGLLEGVRAIYGLHVDPRNDVGTVDLIGGHALAGVDEFTIQVVGKGGHAAFPHATHDPVLAAAHIVTALQQVVARNTDPLEPAVLSVTRIHGGEAFNVIPSRVSLNGTIRSFRNDMHAHFAALLTRTAENVAAAFGCRVEIEQPPGYPPLLNHTEVQPNVERIAASLPGIDNVLHGAPIMASEDFAYFTQEVPAFFTFLGSTTPGTEAGERHMLHHPLFRIDEDALWRGTALMASLALTPEG